jgi:Domain of unknown function (DUF4384)
MTYPGNRMRRGAIAAVGLALLVSTAVPTQAQEAVLLTSTVPGYVPGMLVGTGERLVLPDGASATLLFRSGEVLRLHGPFDGPLALSSNGSSGGAVAALASAFRLQGVDATVIGGTRTTTVPRRQEGLDEVVVDPQRSGTYCVQPSASVWIARPTDDAARYALRRKGTMRVLAWPGDAERIEWPDGMQIEDGDRYEVLVDGVARTTMTFRTLDDQATSTAQWIATGTLRGCGRQFDGPLRRLARSVAPPELYVTSDRGHSPVYRRGDPVVLTAQADSDGYLYCVDVRKGRDAMPIFPAGAVDGAQVHAAVPVTIPGHRSETAMRAAEKGTEEVHCWLADRDISPELPHALIASPPARLPDQIAGELESLFSGIEGSRMARATLRISVE